MISFLVNTYEKDWRWALQLLRQLRLIYPIAEIALICDGFCCAEIAETCQELHVILHMGCRVKTELSHAWSDRLFAVAQAMPGVIIKIDADMWVNRPLELPQGDWDICCDDHIGSPVIGGCIAFNPKVIPRLQDFIQTCQVESYEKSTQPLYCQDKMLRRAIFELSLRALPLPNSKINWLDPVETPSQYAVFGPRIETIELTGQKCRILSLRRSF